MPNPTARPDNAQTQPKNSASPVRGTEALVTPAPVAKPTPKVMAENGVTPPKAGAYPKANGGT